MGSERCKRLVAGRPHALVNPSVTNCTAMSGVMIYPIPSMSQCECGCLWDASQCVSYVLLSPTRYKT